MAEAEATVLEAEAGTRRSPEAGREAFPAVQAVDRHLRLVVIPAMPVPADMLEAATHMVVDIVAATAVIMAGVSACPLVLDWA
jgi:hypothetical protein